MSPSATGPWVTVACGGTGGHLFPGLAVGQVLAARGCCVSLMVSPKDIDRRGVGSAPRFECITLPAVALERGRGMGFVRGAWRSYVQASQVFRARRPAAVLAMGGFTSAPPILAGRRIGAATFIHEANSIPGKANRWLARWADRAFVGFPQTAARLRHCGITVTGTPVRECFQPMDARQSRVRLGLAAENPVLLVMGGSQGAAAINELVIAALAGLQREIGGLQIIHLTGTRDYARVQEAYRAWCGNAIIRDFATEMEVVMGAATVAVTRAGASTLAELAAMSLPGVLVPYPSAADNHQYYNARALADTGAAVMLEQPLASAGALVSLVRELTENEARRRSMQEALRRWHRPEAAASIATEILKRISSSSVLARETPAPGAVIPPQNGELGLEGRQRGMRGELHESWHG